MKKFKVIVKNFKRKDGGTFQKITAKGEFLPLIECDIDKYYTIKFTGELKAPVKEGVWSVACDDKDMWLDTRAEYADKNIIRVRASRIMFEKPLSSLPF